MELKLAPPVYTESIQNIGYIMVVDARPDTGCIGLMPVGQQVPKKVYKMELRPFQLDWDTGELH